MKNKVIIIILVLVIIGMAGVIVYQYTKNNHKEESNNKPENTVNSVAKNEEKITKEKAEEMLIAKYGTKDKETGNIMSYGYIATVQNIEGNKYYAFRHSWLVDGNHMSFLQNIFISLDGKDIKTSEKPDGFDENEIVDFNNI